MLLVVLTFALGLGITLGVLFVFFRDVGPALAILLQFWFWLTPIVYPIDILPEAVRSWLQWNPLVGVMGAMQSIFVFGHWPHWPGLIPAAVLGPLLCLLGLRLYRRHAGEMADQL